MPAALAATGAVVDDSLQQQRRARLQAASEACSSWLEQPGTIWSELVNKSKVGLTGTLQHCPHPESHSANAPNCAPTPRFSKASSGRNAPRPRSCPGGTCSATAAGARAQRPSGTGSTSCSESVQGLEVYCASMQLEVNRKLRRTSSGKRYTSAGGIRRSISGGGSCEQPCDTLAACVSPNIRVTASRVAASKAASSNGRYPGAADPREASASHSGSDTGRAVGLALSLRERVLQLERRNRALEKKLKSIKEENSAKQHAFTATQQTATPKPKQHQQQHEAVQSKPHVSLQVCVLPAHDVAPQLSSCSSCCSTDMLLLAPVTPTASAPNSNHASAADAAASIEMQFLMECDMASCSGTGLEHGEDACTINSSNSNSSDGQQQQAVAPGLEFAACEALPPHTPALLNFSGTSATSAALAQVSEQQHVLPLQREQQHERTIASLQQQLCHMQMVHGLLQNDYADLEFVLKETEKQRREYAARYAFVVIDSDGDGYISMQQVESYELFACYAPQVLHTAFAAWRWQSGFPGFFNIEDFVRLVDYAEDRSSVAAQRFWFSVLDTDGDGHLGWQDMKAAYDAVDKSSARYVVTFADLMNQIRDMVNQQQEPKRGFTFGELRGSKLGPGVIGLLINHNNMLLQRSTAEWGRGEYPL